MKNKNLIIAIMMVLGFAACKPNDPPPDEPKVEGASISLKFDAMFKGAKANWSTWYSNSSNDTFNFERVKFLMSNFVLEKENGEFYTIPDAYAYLSLKDGLDSVVFKNLPKGKYKSIRFKVGLDSAVNHSDPALRALDHPLSPSLNEMHWGWAGGYIFNVLEGYYKLNGVNAGYTYHVALERNARVHSFVENYELSNKARFRFNVHLDKYFDNVVNFSIKTDGSMSHSGDVDPIMDKFVQNLNGIFELSSVE